MYNLLIALGIATVLFVLGWAVGGSWVAGFIPALLGLGVAYFLLARRTGKQLETLLKSAMVEFEKGRVEPGKAIIMQGFELAKWQFLIKEQLHAQLGALAYMQQDFKSAREHLSQAWSRHWQSQAMLSALDHRDKNHAAALERMEKAKSVGGKDAAFWALWVWYAWSADDKDLALKVVNMGLDQVKDSPGLKQLADVIRNDKKLKTNVFRAFQPTWYQFFPEHMPRSMMMEMARQQGVGQPQGRRGYSAPQPRFTGKPR